MAKLDDVKKHMKDVASSLASGKESKAAAAKQAQQKLDQQKDEELARATRVQAIVDKSLRPTVEHVKSTLGLEEVVLDDGVRRMIVPAGASAAESAELLSMRSVVLAFRHPVDQERRCTLTFGHLPDDTIVLYTDRAKVGSVHAGALSSEAAFAALAPKLEELIADAMMKLLNESLP